VTPPAPTEQVPALADGRRLVGTLVVGRYRVKRVIGVGGKGTVYEAEDQTMRRDVALKVPTTSTEDSIKRFLREGRAGASLAHPNVCAIFDFGPLEDGTPFLVMERLVGETLAELFARAPKVALETMLPVVQQLLAGLEAAHAQGIVHRDIKPGNVFLTQPNGEEGIAKLLDFGASTLDPARRSAVTEDFESLTKVGTAIGTPIYMCPEQIRGQRDLDARVDLYACGVMLYEALTGTPPYNAAKRVELFRLILAGKFTPASHIDPSIPHRVDAVLARALAPDRIDRYPDARSFIDALESLRHDHMESSSGLGAAGGALESIRLVELQQRLAEVSNFYESAGSLRVAKRVTTLDIPIEEDLVEIDEELNTLQRPTPVVPSGLHPPSEEEAPPSTMRDPVVNDTEPPPSP